MRDIEDMTKVSHVFASPKRLIILHLLENEPLSYSGIREGFNRLKIKVGSSEIFKHLKMLLDNGYIVKKGKQYLKTSKGCKALKLINELVRGKVRVPKLRIEF